MKIYTKKGDTGETSLLGGARVKKHHVRIEAYGTIDELNSFIGLLHDQPVAGEYGSLLQTIQNRLFVIGSYLATDPSKENKAIHPDLHVEDIVFLEKSIDEFDAQLSPLKNFILPGGHPANSLAHVARCVCRRAERMIVELNEETPVEPLLITYLNRLSDWLFIFARVMTKITGSPEIIWETRKRE